MRLAVPEWPAREEGLLQRKIQGPPWEGKGMELGGLKTAEEVVEEGGRGGGGRGRGIVVAAITITH